MENQDSTNNLNLRRRLSMVGVIRETMKTIVRNRTVVIVNFCLLSLINIIWDLEPLQEELGIQISYGTPRHVTGRVHEPRVHEPQPMKSIILFCCWLCLYMSFQIATISSSYESYKGNTLSILGAFLKMSRNWKRPLLTFGCILLLSLGINLVYSFCFVVIPSLARMPHVTSSSLFYIASIVLKWTCNVHMAALGTMAIVVSVLDDNISGLKAIHRAGDLLKGRRIQASVIIVLNHIASRVSRNTFDALSVILEEEVMRDIKIRFLSLFKIFVFVFYTVLYHECKMVHKEDAILCASNVMKKSL